jgi:multiple sugar transport system substrate-binding protein
MTVELRGVTWDHVRGYGGLRAAAEAFTRERPDVRVTWQARSLQAFADQPVEELERYDLIVLDHPSIGAAVTRGAIVPLDEHLGADILDDQRRASVGRSFESYTWHGHQWALPVDAAAQVAAYRDDLLDDLGVPSTWEEVLRTAARLRERDLWIAMPAIPVDAICAFLAVSEAAFGADVAVDRGTGREALAILGEVMELGHPMSLTSNPPTAFDHMAANDDVAYCPLAFGYVNYARATGGTHAVRFAPGPGPSGSLGGAGIAVSGGSEHAGEASAFAAFACSEDVQRGPYVERGGQPGHRSAWTDPDVDADANGFFSSTLPALDAAYLRPRYDGFLAFQDAAGELVHAYLREGGDADEVLDRIDEAYRASKPEVSER